MLLGTLGASLLENLLTGKGILRASSGNKKEKGNKKGKGIVRAGYCKRMGFLIPPHSWTNFEIQKYYKNEPRFNCIFSRNNLPKKKIKDGVYKINLDEHANVGIHWIALSCKKNKIIYFDSFDVEYIPNEIKEFIEEFPKEFHGNKNI